MPLVHPMNAIFRLSFSIIVIFIVPIYSQHPHQHHHHTVRQLRNVNNQYDHTIVDSPTFLSTDDFHRASALEPNLTSSETKPKPVVLAPLNDPEMHYTYYEGDMIVQESDEKKVAMYSAKRWPYGRIPYIMENKFNDEERAAIARGMMILQERTCIRFVPKQHSDRDYVFLKRGPGCAAHVGRIGGQQWVILGDGCYGIETVTHELMHSVGFIHEQSRPDRDEHVEIVWNNIKSNAKRNFRKHDFDYLADHGFPYDLMSVMHYRQYAFSKNRKPTILPKRPVPYLRCRGSNCPSELDIEKINFLYKCFKKDHFDDNGSNDIDDDNFEENHNSNNENAAVDIDELMIANKNNHIYQRFNPKQQRYFYQQVEPPIFDSDFPKPRRQIMFNVAPPPSPQTPPLARPPHHHHPHHQLMFQGNPYPMINSVVLPPPIPGIMLL